MLEGLAPTDARGHVLHDESAPCERDDDDAPGAGAGHTGPASHRPDADTSIEGRHAQVRPERIVAVKATIAGVVRRAVSLAGLTIPALTLPIPVRYWHAAHFQELADALPGRAWSAVRLAHLGP